MKTVILDGYTENPGDLSWGPLEKYGELTVYDRTPFDEEEILRRIGDAEIVLTNKTPLTKHIMESARIRYISVLATGYNVVDYEAAAGYGIPVSNVPGYGTASVGQHAVALLLEICNHVQRHADAVAEGRWSSCQDWCFWDCPMIELAGKTIGIIGYGRIGKTTATVAKALGMNVIATSRSKTSGGDDIAEFTDMDTVFARSDVISLHCPLFPETKDLIRRENIEKMKDGVILINNSRGQLVVEQDLADALNSGKVAAAGLDVVSTEPIRPDNPLLQAKNCLITPHISWASKESRQRIMDITAENIRTFLDGAPQNVVNGVK